MPPKKRWGYRPPKPAKPKIPDGLKVTVEKKADELVESFLKPTYVEEGPPEGTEWNYIVDIYTKWYRSYFYFCAKYHCPAENRIADDFEVKFTRLEYAGSDQFHIAHMRHTGQWENVFYDLTLDESIESIQENRFLQP